MAFDDRRRLWLACQTLPQPQRTAIVLRYDEQLEYAEIAELTGVREGTVRSRVSRGSDHASRPGPETSMTDPENR